MVKEQQDTWLGLGDDKERVDFIQELNSKGRFLESLIIAKKAIDEDKAEIPGYEMRMPPRFRTEDIACNVDVMYFLEGMNQDTSVKIQSNDFSYSEFKPVGEDGKIKIGIDVDPTKNTLLVAQENGIIWVYKKNAEPKKSLLGKPKKIDLKCRSIDAFTSLGKGIVCASMYHQSDDKYQYKLAVVNSKGKYLDTRLLEDFEGMSCIKLAYDGRSLFAVMDDRRQRSHIVRFDDFKQYPAVFKLSEHNRFATDITIGPDGNLYVATRKYQHITPESTEIWKLDKQLSGYAEKTCHLDCQDIPAIAFNSEGDLITAIRKSSEFLPKIYKFRFTSSV